MEKSMFLQPKSKSGQQKFRVTYFTLVYTCPMETPLVASWVLIQQRYLAKQLLSSRRIN